MNVSYQWLREFTDVDVPAKVFAHEMNMTGTEIKGYERIGKDICNIKVGKILSITRHPDADKLVICSVDIGNEQPIQIVTAATNVFEGALVPVSLDGAVLYDGTRIKKTKLRGVPSDGMFCSVAELGLTVNDYPGAIEDGILIFRDGTPGEDVCEKLGLDDLVFEADIVTNRPDCLCMSGVAREAAVTFRKPFRMPTPVVKGGGVNVNDYLTVDVQNSKLCRRYMARVVTDVKIEPSPLWMIERLRSSGVRAINNIVDITNYVMLEYGQPMHAFDYRCVEGGKIVVRNAAEGETMTTLDGTERALTSDMLVIADAIKPIALAGIMGGENSEITENTKTIVLESANFSGKETRHTAKKLGMRTESSARFEKNLDPALTEKALNRACELIELLGAGTVSSTWIDVDNSNHAVRTVRLEKDWINRYLDISASEEEMKDILTRLGFTINGDELLIPSYRGDVENKYDISEEIARFYGYDNIPAKPFTAVLHAGGYTERQKFDNDIGKLLRAQGLDEIVTFSFIGPKAFDRLRLPENSPLRHCLKIQNPLGEDTSIMRTTALPSMMDTLARNHAFRAENLAMYELATVYIRGEDDRKLPEEPKVAEIGLCGKSYDYFGLKGIVENLLAGLHIHKVSYRVPAEIPPYFHPGRVAEAVRDGEVLGVFGQLHPLVAKNYDMDMPVFVAELNAEKMFAAHSTEKEYRPIPKFPAVTRDLALVCSENVFSAELEDKIREIAGKYLESITVFDVYRGQQIGEGFKSIAYSLVLRSADHTLTDEETDKIMTRILKALDAMEVHIRQ